MRLLYTADNGKLGWTDDLVGKQIPPYAILSHTWDGQEVAYKDLQNHRDIGDVDARLKGGYQKIFFCAAQAKRDGLDYFWVDTCCIDKANSQELQEAINSMFRWYQNSKKCYVYLSDVEHGTLDGEGESAFKQSRWFTRGWTLQELLAPKSVEFFSFKEVRLGDKESLKSILHKITKVPVQALSGSRLSEYSVSERFSWAENRQTTREEDQAYCLLGMLNVHLPLIYGERKENALDRLRDAVAAKNNKGRPQPQEERLGKICTWLSAPDPSTNYHKAHKQRQAETGLWLLHNARFAEWKGRTASRLWLHGIPGCGKTILSSTVIEHLLQHCHDDARMVTAYFYFDFNDAQKQNPELMLRSLLSQLLQRSVTIPKGVDALFSACDNGQRQPSLHALLEVLPPVMQQFTHVYVVLDALDECTQRPELMDVLETVAGWQLDNMHLLMTSRKERDIESSLGSYVKEEDTICLQREVVDKDIQQYVQQRLSNDKTLAKWNKDAAVKQEIEDALICGARGMCRNRAMLRKSLATLPQTLDQTYDRILTAISEEDAEYAMRILQWLTFSARPLSVEEVAEVVAIDVTGNRAFDRDEVLEDPLEALNICSSLVTVTTNKAGRRSSPAQRTIALAHYSVQEYLVSERIKQGQAKRFSMQDFDCHDTISKGCLIYLLQFQQPLTTKVLGVSALARYAAEFWSSHIQKTRDEAEGSADVNAQGGRYSNALQAASAGGHEQVVKMLLNKGADVNAQGGDSSNALYAASFRGHKQVVKMLLNKDAEVNAQGGHFGNALQAASAGGHKQVVKMLLNKDADVNAQGRWYSNALQAASYGGHKQVVKMLLNKGADVNAQGRYYGNALQAASYEGHEQVVKMLLNKDANVNAQGGDYGNALQAASYEGHKQVVKMLLNKGADVNAKGGGFSNALQAASASGDKQVVKMLLNKGANVNAQGGRYSNALQAASYGGHKQVVKMLLNKGADVNAKGGPYSNALQAASYEGHKQVVKMLLGKGADVNAQGKEGYVSRSMRSASCSALYTASARGHKQVVEMLLNKGAEVNAQGGEYGNALQAASYGGYKLVVKMLLDAGAHQSKKDAAAVLKQSVSIVQAPN
ncbi:hypothetical protein N0V87_010137 [Didymella glomerata]|uniref:Vegetative incompatibility protein HET-E-1 n=1 Tax=Didymella glomerata TaxID=749621 RepID=A0A9W9BVD3_9PLEO|nr:hypothetical protein N0V87_010137 [Didymella glomerata]